MSEIVFCHKRGTQIPLWNFLWVMPWKNICQKSEKREENHYLLIQRISKHSFLLLHFFSNRNVEFANWWENAFSQLIMCFDWSYFVSFRTNNFSHIVTIWNGPQTLSKKIRISTRHEIGLLHIKASFFNCLHHYETFYACIMYLLLYVTYNWTMIFLSIFSKTKN